MEREGAGATVPTYSANFFQDNGDGTYVLYVNSTMDLSGPSGGYLSTAGGATISYGPCTVATADGETVYTLSKPTRVVKSSYMMTGPDNTIEIYVDSADSSTYSSYSVSDITGMKEDEVIDTPLKTSVMGQVAEGDAPFITSVAVDTDTFQITDIY